MRASDFDAQQRIYNLKGEIEAIAIIVRQMRERNASGNVASAQARLAAARAQLQQLSRPPRTALGMSPPIEF
jgi:hypothetical protein